MIQKSIKFHPPHHKIPQHSTRHIIKFHNCYHTNLHLPLLLLIDLKLLMDDPLKKNPWMYDVILSLEFYPIMISGDLIISDRIDYEALENKQLSFDLAVYDAGVPQFR